jgi:chemotaxis signal transduction protein/ligand-binding sensor protein
MSKADKEISVSFSALFDLKEIQKLQDAFAKAVGVASIITGINGYPITEPSNFCRLCTDIIRKTEKGLANCMKSDAEIGRCNPDGPVIQPCLSGGLWDAGASIMAGDTHIANWLIGQVRNEAQDIGKMIGYARQIGADEDEFRSAPEEVPVMSFGQFEKAGDALFLMANQMSRTAFQNIRQRELTEKLEREISEREKAEEEIRLLRKKKERYERYMIFGSDGEEYGISISKIQEITEIMPVTHVPGTPDFMKGVINLRGKIIPVIDFGLRLGLKAGACTERSCIIIVDTEGRQTGIAVDSVTGVSDIKGEDIDDMPVLDPKSETGYISGLDKSGEKIRILLNIEQIVSSEEIKQHFDR